jgi:uncharacterized membrane protein
MTKQELLEHLDRLIEQADIVDIGFGVIREHLDKIHADLDQLEKQQQSTEETPEQE